MGTWARLLHGLRTTWRYYRRRLQHRRSAYPQVTKFRLELLEPRLLLSSDLAPHPVESHPLLDQIYSAPVVLHQLEQRPGSQLTLDLGGWNTSAQPDPPAPLLHMSHLAPVLFAPLESTGLPVEQLRVATEQKIRIEWDAAGYDEVMIPAVAADVVGSSVSSDEKHDEEGRAVGGTVKLDQLFDTSFDGDDRLTAQLVKTLHAANAPPEGDVLTRTSPLFWVEDADGFWNGASNGRDVKGVSHVQIAQIPDDTTLRGFEPNLGQASAQVDFLWHRPDYTLFLTSDGATLRLAAGTAGHSLVQMQFIGANLQSVATGIEQLPGTTDALVRTTPSRWRR